MAYLEVVNGPGVGLQYRLTDDRTTIGRHPECQIVLEQVGQVSRKHAQIVRQGDDFYAGDLGSRKDRHAHVGEGACGEACFRTIVNHRRLTRVPKILETPKGEDMAEDRMNLRVLRRLAATQKARN